MATREKKEKSKLREYVEILLIAGILALFIRTFLIQAYTIPSGSMLDTLLIGDHLFVNKVTYGVKIPFTDTILFSFADPEHGDIMVFKFPNDPSKDYIKRLIGEPGDTIEIIDKQVWRNGELLDEPYVQHTDAFVQPSACTGPSITDDPHPRCPCRDNIAEFTVPEGQYFFMGDNRDDSVDSRCWGYVDRELIKGKAWFIYWSWEGFSNIRWGRLLDGVHE